MIPWDLPIPLESARVYLAAVIFTILFLIFLLETSENVEIFRIRRGLSALADHVIWTAVLTCYMAAGFGSGLLMAKLRAPVPGVAYWINHGGTQQPSMTDALLFLFPLVSSVLALALLMKIIGAFIPAVATYSFVSPLRLPRLRPPRLRRRHIPF